MLHVLHYGARLAEEKKKERKKEGKKMNDSGFRPFQVCHFKIVTTCCYYYCRQGQALEAALRMYI